MLFHGHIPAPGSSLCACLRVDCLKGRSFTVIEGPQKWRLPAMRRQLVPINDYRVSGSETRANSGRWYCTSSPVRHMPVAVGHSVIP